jgi:hypothetical protein
MTKTSDIIQKLNDIIPKDVLCEDFEDGKKYYLEKISAGISSSMTVSVSSKWIGYELTVCSRIGVLEVAEDTDNYNLNFLPNNTAEVLNKTFLVVEAYKNRSIWLLEKGNEFIVGIPIDGLSTELHKFRIRKLFFKRVIEARINTVKNSSLPKNTTKVVNI